MIKQAQELVQRHTPIPTLTAQLRANCFNAVLFIWGDQHEAQFVGPEEFVRAIQNHFLQIPLNDPMQTGDVTIIWSRTSDILPTGHIQMDQLKKDQPGYPFGLVIEHAFTYLDENQIFQKKDPSENGPYEIISNDEAIQPYRTCNGFEITRHRRKS